MARADVDGDGVRAEYDPGDVRVAGDPGQVGVVKRPPLPGCSASRAGVCLAGQQRLVQRLGPCWFGCCW